MENLSVSCGDSGIWRCGAKILDVSLRRLWMRQSSPTVRLQLSWCNLERSKSN